MQQSEINQRPIIIPKTRKEALQLAQSLSFVGMSKVQLKAIMSFMECAEPEPTGQFRHSPIVSNGCHRTRAITKNSV